MVLAQKQTHRSMEYKRPEINPPTYVQLIYNKEGKNAQWRKDSVFNKWCWKNRTATMEKNRTEVSGLERVASVL